MSGESAHTQKPICEICQAVPTATEPIFITKVNGRKVWRCDAHFPEEAAQPQREARGADEVVEACRAESHSKEFWATIQINKQLRSALERHFNQRFNALKGKFTLAAPKPLTLDIDFAKEIHAFFNSEACGFYEGGDKCLSCEAIAEMVAKRKALKPLGEELLRDVFELFNGTENKNAEYAVHRRDGKRMELPELMTLGRVLTDAIAQALRGRV